MIIFSSLVGRTSRELSWLGAISVAGRPSRAAKGCAGVARERQMIGVHAPSPMGRDAHDPGVRARDARRPGSYTIRRGPWNDHLGVVCCWWLTTDRFAAQYPAEAAGRAGARWISTTC